MTRFANKEECKAFIKKELGIDKTTTAYRMWYDNLIDILFKDELTERDDYVDLIAYFLLESMHENVLTLLLVVHNFLENDMEKPVKRSESLSKVDLFFNELNDEDYLNLSPNFKKNEYDVWILAGHISDIVMLIINCERDIEGYVITDTIELFQQIIDILYNKITSRVVRKRLIRYISQHMLFKPSEIRQFNDLMRIHKIKQSM